MAKKEDREINPVIEDKKVEYDLKELKQLAHNIENTTITTQNSDSDSFFKELVKQLNDRKNISVKTEYLSVEENFNGVKLEFLSMYGLMPYLKNFVNMFETKRVSLHRKGRQEDVMILQERKQEEQNDKMKDFAKLFNVG